MNSAQILRAIGQDLERLSIGKFKLHFGDYGIVIRELLQVGIHSWEPNGAPTHVRNLHYSLRQMETLDAQGRRCRLHAGDFPSSSQLSNILRAAGNLVDLKCGQLVSIRKSDDRSVEVRYETLRGNVLREILDVSELYAVFVSFSLKRSDAGGPLLASPIFSSILSPG